MPSQGHKDEPRPLRVLGSQPLAVWRRAAPLKVLGSSPWLFVILWQPAASASSAATPKGQRLVIHPTASGARDHDGKTAPILHPRTSHGKGRTNRDQRQKLANGQSDKPQWERIEDRTRNHRRGDAPTLTRSSDWAHCQPTRERACTSGTSSRGNEYVGGALQQIAAGRGALTADGLPSPRR